MRAFTTPAFFAAESLLIYALWQRAPLALPWQLFAAHLAFHLAYTMVAALAPRWAVGVNVWRVRRAGEGLGLGLAALAALGLTVLNALDCGCHIAYAVAAAHAAAHYSNSVALGFAVAAAAAALGALTWNAARPQQRHLQRASSVL